MASITDEWEHNQGFKPCPALTMRTLRRADYILQATGLQQGMYALEIGCGTGEMAYHLGHRSGADILGIDRSQRFVAMAESAYGHSENMAFRVINFDNEAQLSSLYGRFHCVVGNGILHHLMPALEESLQCIRKLLMPGGRICFIEPNLWNPYVYAIFTYAPLRRLAKLEPAEMAFSRPYIASLLARNGFSKIDVQCADFLLPNTPTRLIKPVIALGSILEKTPAKYIAQSLFISAAR